MSHNGIRLSIDKLGAYLRGARLASGLTQAEAAERAGCSRSTVSRIERGALNVRISWPLILGDVLGAPFSFELACRWEPGR